jgi:adenylate kinase
MKKIIFFLGPPGSGKGTQAKKMAAKYGYKHVSTGDLIRSISTDPEATEDERKILREVNLEGHLAPDWFICGLVFRAVERFVNKKEVPGMIFDGAIRTLQQAERIQQYLETKDLDKDIQAVAVIISDRESYDRLTKRRVCAECREIIPWLPATKDLTACPKCGGSLKSRPDDKPETIKKRIVEQGNAALAPILDYFRGIGALDEINGEQSIDDVAADVDRVMLQK